MTIFIEILAYLANHIIFGYALIVCSAYLILAVVSLAEIASYMRRNRFVDYDTILSSPLAPSISLMVPAYNEGLNIIDSVRSLLSLRYNKYEIIVINDGSTDDSMKKLIDHFNLVCVNFAVNTEIQTKKIRGVYKSSNQAFKKLVVVDKENGGKADALNAGLNVSQSKLVATMDADSIIAPDALLTMVKPFLHNTTRVIATGGVVRIANSCEIEDGRLVKVHLPNKMLARFQALEYLRVFLLSRIAWSRLNGLLLISGAFGLFDREIAVKAGGYSHRTVGEDMELVVRMRTYMHRNKLAYKVFYIPDPLCWTEAPANLKILGKQRNRWARGTAQTLWLHKKLFMNPKYGLMGILSFPFWLFFEYLAPFIEIAGITYFFILVFLSQVNWVFFISLFLMIYTFAVFISVLALIAEEITFYQYNHKSDALKLAATAFVEPFLFHPFTLVWALMGNIYLI
jgi:cellulose synthase/poly-beta-1,6-N-acetylglucosamine synthase-like glycosyltransferase